MRFILLALLVAGGVHAEAIRLGATADRAITIMADQGNAATLTIDAMPYARTVTCSGDYTLTGTYTGAIPTWSTSPSGASGACEDNESDGTFFCVVEVLPDATGEGIETVTVTNGASDTETIGFYVTDTTGDTASELHSCFLSQSVNGAYNVGLSNLDAVATWDNMGTSALDVTQGTGAAQPTFRTGIVGGQPVVRCDGGDRVAASTGADWTFLHNGTDWTVEHVTKTTNADPNAIQVVASTLTDQVAAQIGAMVLLDDRAAASRNDRVGGIMANGAALILNGTSANGAAAQQVFNLVSNVLDEGSGTEFTALVNGTSAISTASVTGYSASAPTQALNICRAGATNYPLTGDLFRVLIYQSALTSTQRGINKAVDEWALGASLPVTP